MSMLLPTVVGLLPAASAASRSAASSAPAQDAVLPRDVPGPVVVVGTTGVSWADVTGAGTPTLWELGTRASGANLVVRSVRSSACPIDGWLGLSAGRRAGDVAPAEWGVCRLPVTPEPDEPVPGWEEIVAANADASYGATPGLLGAALAEAGATARGIGAGAAIALAGTDGRPVGAVTPLPTTGDQLAGRVRSALNDGAELLVVDVGDVRDAGRPLQDLPYPRHGTGAGENPSADNLLNEFTQPDPPSILGRLDELPREAQLFGVDNRLRAVLGELARTAPEATVLVASLADPGTRSGLRLAAAQGPGFTDAGAGLLRSNSTRQTGYLQGYDLTPTVLTALGLSTDAQLAGALAHTDPETLATQPSPERLFTLADDQRHAAAVPSAAPTFTLVLIVANLLVYATVTVALNRTVLDRVGPRLRRRSSRPDAATTGGTVGGAAGGAAGGERSRDGSHAADQRLPVVSRRMDVVLRVLRAVATAVAALPICATLANLLPWWRASSTGWALAATIGGWAIVLAALALVGPWRRWLLGPMGFISAVTAIVLAVDVATGARLQISNVLGIQPQVGARFYGINNQSFALFATSSLLLATCLAEPLVRRGRRSAAAAVVLAIGAVQVLLNGLPSIGADFGGPPAAIPGFLLLAIMAGGLRLTVKRVLGVLLVAGAVVFTFVFVDWLRPPSERTHLGQFFQSVIDGEAAAIVGRKLASNLSLLFGTPLTILALAGIVVVVVVLSRPLQAERRSHSTSRVSAGYGWLTGGPSILRLDRSALMLRPGLIAVAVTLTLGFALNDSGILVPALGIALLVPLLIAVLCSWLLRLRGVEPASDGAFVTGEDLARTGL